jgi:hypothetical protein
MIVTVLFLVGQPILVFGFRLLFHLIDPGTYGPAGTPTTFAGITGLMAVFGFIIAVTVGATAGTTDLTDGVFRNLVITGRSRLALFLARIPAGLAILLPLAAAGFTIACLVTAFLGSPQPSAISEGTVSVPAHLSQSQLQTWVIDHPRQAGLAFGFGPESPAAARVMAKTDITSIYTQYTNDEAGELNPSASTMVAAGLWIELEVLVGFTVGLGLGSLMGQRTVPVILLTVLEVIITPALAGTTLPYFINGQRLIVGIPLGQLQPQGVGAGQSVLGHVLGGRVGGTGSVAHTGSITPALAMPTWALVAIIVGWIVGWSILGAWRMVTRDA